MTTTDDQRKKRIEREQGDVNTTPNREKYWAATSRAKPGPFSRMIKPILCSRRYTNQPAVDLARKLAHITPRGLCKSLGGGLHMGIDLVRDPATKERAERSFGKRHRPTERTAGASCDRP
ncbi:MAG: hypothetical protein ABFS43_13790 [Thermodesulfobacteriota bacterium]